MAFQITTLMENTSPRNFLAAEHGLSLLIEGAGLRILYDTGTSPRFLKNAASLGVELSPLDALVFSHGHYDHTGGAAALLTGPIRPGAVYLGKDFFQSRFSPKGDGLMDIGAAVDQGAFERAGVPCHVVGAEPLALGGGLWLVSGFESTQPMEGPSPSLLRLGEKGMEEDAFQDEVAVVLDTPGELALVSGCSHVGILSMCRRVEELFSRRVDTFVGGTHLMGASQERIAFTCDQLSRSGLRRLGACHCSGAQAGEYFQAHFPGYFFNNVGTRLTVG